MQWAKTNFPHCAWVATFPCDTPFFPEDIVEKIIDIIDEATRDDLLKVGTHIFEIGAANRFYSNLYAKLFKELVNRFSSFKSIFVENYKNFIRSC